LTGTSSATVQASLLPVAENAVRQVCKQLLFSAIVNLLTLVAAGIRKSVNDAYLAKKQEFRVSVTSVYNKLQGVETQVSRQLVRQTALHMIEVVKRLRGRHKTSFRLYEAIQMGAIPVYIYDEPWLPYRDVLDWNSFSVLVHVDQVRELPEILYRHTPQEIADKQTRLRSLFADYFSFDGTCRQILRMLGEQPVRVNSAPGGAPPQGDRVAPGGFPPGAPTDPNVRN